MRAEIINIHKYIITIKAWRETPGRVFLIKPAIGESKNEIKDGQHSFESTDGYKYFWGDPSKRGGSEF